VISGRFLKYLYFIPPREGKKSNQRRRSTLVEEISWQLWLIMERSGETVGLPPKIITFESNLVVPRCRRSPDSSSVTAGWD